MESFGIQKKLSITQYSIFLSILYSCILWNPKKFKNAEIELDKYMYLSCIHSSMHQYQIWNFSVMGDSPIKIWKNS